ncbi:hypothetical protein ABFS83_14G065800 [Erythranthe nasuta]
MDNNNNNKGVVLLERYELGRLLGQGTFAKVFYARSVQTGQSVAIKVIDKLKITKVGVVDQIKREISIMRLVKHPNIVHLHEVMATKTKIYFVMEYAKGGELFHKVSKGKLKEDVARKYFQQLINAVDFCHSRGVYHRDLKPENILLDENENLKVSDFGLSALSETRRSDGLLHTTCGTPAYVAPEVIDRKGYNGTSADIWSCGVILFVLLAGYLPFHDSNLMEMYRKIARAEFRFPSWFSPEARRLISRLLDPNPNTRISVARIKGSSWFKRELKSKATKTNDPQSSVIAVEEEEGGSREREIVDSESRLSNLNAFDIISLSEGFNLSRLFEESRRRADRETRFVSRKPACAIISKLEEVAKHVKMKINKKDGGLFKFEGTKEGRKGILSIEAEIFVLAQSLHLVEVKKTSGDTLEYRRVLDEGLRPGLQDIVWSSMSEVPQLKQEEDSLQKQPLLMRDRIP